MENFTPTERTTVRRLAKRGSYDRALVYSILDEALYCHVGFIAGGRPVVIPTIHVRIDDRLYVHGSAASHMLRSLRDGVEACVTVTLMDGLVLARSAFHHSMNYRSVMIFGTAMEVVEREEKLAAFEKLVEHVVHGRAAEIRGPNDREMRQTLLLALPLEEVSAKVRTGPPIDDEEDYAMSVWAGVLPLTITPGAPIADPRLPDGTPVPEHVKEYKR
jgi:nitroimidazol reductase NimA-like FMN-containing flavoprotein (pyridoxamine 5'-phosphate oxidase superfamily)